MRSVPRVAGNPPSSPTTRHRRTTGFGSRAPQSDGRELGLPQPRRVREQVPRIRRPDLSAPKKPGPLSGGERLRVAVSAHGGWVRTEHGSLNAGQRFAESLAYASLGSSSGRPRVVAVGFTLASPQRPGGDGERLDSVTHGSLRPRPCITRCVTALGIARRGERLRVTVPAHPIVRSRVGSRGVEQRGFGRWGAGVSSPAIEGVLKGQAWRERGCSARNAAQPTPGGLTNRLSTRTPTRTSSTG